MDFAQIWVILRGKWALRARGLKGSRAQALSGLEPTRAQARLVQPLVTTLHYYYSRPSPSYVCGPSTLVGLADEGFLE